jgi:hypothetical protein
MCIFGGGQTKAAAAKNEGYRSFYFLFFGFEITIFVVVKRIG